MAAVTERQRGQQADGEETRLLTDAEARATSAESRVALLEERLKQVSKAAREQQEALLGLRQARQTAERAGGGPKPSPSWLGSSQAAYQALLEAESRAIMLAQKVETFASAADKEGSRCEGARLSMAEEQAEKADRIASSSASRQQRIPASSAAETPTRRGQEDGALRGQRLCGTAEPERGSPSLKPKQINDSSARLLARDLEVAAAEGMAQEMEVSRLRAEGVAVRKQAFSRKKGKAVEEGMAMEEQFQHEQEAMDFDGGDAKENESEMAQFAMLEGWCFERDWCVTEARAAATHSTQASTLADIQNLGTKGGGLDGRAQLRGAEANHEGSKDQDALRDHLAESEFASVTETVTASDHVARAQAKALVSRSSSAGVGTSDESREEAERQMAALQAESRDRPVRREQLQPGDMKTAGNGPQDEKLQALQQHLDNEKQASQGDNDKELAVARQTLAKE